MRIEPLDDADRLSLATFTSGGERRLTGARFAGGDGRFVVELDADADALRDLANDSRVEIAAGDGNGEVMPGAAVLAGAARILEDEHRVDEEHARIRKKYGLARRAVEAGAGLWHKARGNDPDPPVLVEVVLTEAV
jgi:hypothetical protein